MTQGTTKQIAICPTCGSAHIFQDATSYWDTDKQAWLLSDCDGPLGCHRCGVETKYGADPLHAERTVIAFAEAATRLELDAADKSEAEDGEPEYQFDNFYEHCGQEWTMTHAAACNDRCPICRQEIEPYDSIMTD